MKNKIYISLMIIIILLLLVVIGLLLFHRGNESNSSKTNSNHENIIEKVPNHDEEKDEEDTEDGKDVEKEQEIIQNSGISREEAIDIALNDANTDKSSLVFLTTYIQKYNGVFCYHVKFKTQKNYVPYDYIVNAMSGEIELSAKH